MQNHGYKVDDPENWVVENKAKDCTEPILPLNPCYCSTNPSCDRNDCKNHRNDPFQPKVCFLFRHFYSSLFLYYHPTRILSTVLTKKFLQFPRNRGEKTNLPPPNFVYCFTQVFLYCFNLFYLCYGRFFCDWFSRNFYCSRPLSTITLVLSVCICWFGVIT